MRHGGGGFLASRRCGVALSGLRFPAARTVADRPQADLSTPIAPGSLAPGRAVDVVPAGSR